MNKAGWVRIGIQKTNGGSTVFHSPSVPFEERRKINMKKHLPYDLSPEELTMYTSSWTGERDMYGRPYVADHILDAIEKYVSIPCAWEALNHQGYVHQTITGYDSTLPDQAMVGRALTAVYLPLRPDMRKQLMTEGHHCGENGDMVSWPIERLQKRDVYVADVFGKHEFGPIIGERLASAIYNRSGNGAVHYASVRDIDGIRGIRGFNAFYKGVHPSHGSPTTINLMGINCPIRMERVCVMPGDVVLAKEDTVLFIPPQFAEKIAMRGTVVHFM
ncbi:MAG: hypothetical protein RR361_08665, partial [Anaerovorax sp.]